MSNGKQEQAGPKEAVGVPHRQLGHLLRDMRSATGLTIHTAARLIGRGDGTLQRLETGEAKKIHDEDLEKLCGLYSRDDLLPVLKMLAAQSREPNWWQQFGDVILGSFDIGLGLEANAHKLRIYRTDMISGLFQTANYARALDRLYFTEDTPEALQRRVEVRRMRQKRITRRHSPIDVELIIDEGVLYKNVGGPKVMAAQCRHLADLPMNVTLRILPDSVGFPLGIATGPFTILDFGVGHDGQPIQPSVVYIECFAGDLYLERPTSVERYREAFGGVQRVALSVAESKHLLRQVAKEYDRGGNRRRVGGLVVQEQP
ncbi:helix-turn-helix domain-containing protein [Nocardia sp. CDC159]|uniref:Helix-turn-helix domain-containing protein n=1 Tax=Nocardia pulmonis TaxID=2951408 RepID=A0A9X2IWU4_9NOCA|nr:MULTISPECIES: helix-turn-helix transcriptional regulator [Nocardia]MCM6775312.1 helix-turn-helix domain-containing protein [Nocardia pulmonis]MCM6787954.1 helix-turn-helix domain-containing protein [Nocardia sp. CDC159]